MFELTLEEVNEARRKRGLPPLPPGTDLTPHAQSFKAGGAALKAAPSIVLPKIELPEFPFLPDTRAEDAAALERKRRYKEQRARAYSAGGRRGTLLTGGLGLTSLATTARKTLLGS